MSEQKGKQPFGGKAFGDLARDLVKVPKEIVLAAERRYEKKKQQKKKRRKS